MALNIPLAKAVLEQVESEPDAHDQGNWRSTCGTTLCIAGWAVRLTAIEQNPHFAQRSDVVGIRQLMEKENQLMRDTVRDNRDELVRSGWTSHEVDETIIEGEIDFELAAAALLGLNLRDALRLFWNMSNESAKRVLATYIEAAGEGA